MRAPPLLTFVQVLLHRCLTLQSCLGRVSCRWRWRCLVRRAAALLIKAAAAAASGKLLPCIACAFAAARRRLLPLLILPSAGALLIELLAACRWTAADAGCWRRQAARSCALFIACVLDTVCRTSDGRACTCLGSTLAPSGLCCLPSSCFPGSLVVRACK